MGIANVEWKTRSVVREFKVAQQVAARSSRPNFQARRNGCLPPTQAVSFTFTWDMINDVHELLAFISSANSPAGPHAMELDYLRI